MFALVSFAYPLFAGSIVGCFVDRLTDMAGNREVLTKKLHKQGFYICAIFAKDCMGKVQQKRFLPSYLGIGPISVWNLWQKVRQEANVQNTFDFVEMEPMLCHSKYKEHSFTLFLCQDSIKANWNDSRLDASILPLRHSSFQGHVSSFLHMLS